MIKIQHILGPLAENPFIWSKYDYGTLGISILV